ncbi:hypothetical protein [Chamaesiphon polymorphus]|uniref:Uncharacterized protein n=1 Tax=Chamaesiphon polymorphus CCALA 037 TaxID=2107692 RepID=A0A2T1G102_9CYAN|nr:hypothetical protein [Chamaesiphon polymorphus]PSB50928.1 hypothetical protein C7B77_22170 [Chamaesiphon polymorphus CCALA 037]
MRSIDFGNKSFNTKIQIAKDGDFFEIYIPPFGFCLEILVLIIFTVFWNYSVVGGFFGLTQIPFMISIIFMLLQLPFCGIGVFLVYTCLFVLFGKTYFRINRHEICLIETLFGWKVSHQRPKREITEIIFKRNSFYADSDSDGFALVEFKIRKHSIELGALRSGINHDTEVEWLAYEISEWLDKPLTILEAPLKKLKGNFK